MFECLYRKYILNTWYIFTVLALSIFILSIISIFSVNMDQILQFAVVIALPAFFLVILFLYLIVAIKSPGEARKRALGITIGLSIMMIGPLFGSSFIGVYLDPLGLYAVRILFEPFIVIAGSSIFTFSQR